MYVCLQWIMFPIGIVITVIGVYYLSRRETVRGRRKSILTLVELVELGTHSSPSVSEVTVFQAKEGIATTNPLGLAVPLHAQVKEGVV